MRFRLNGIHYIDRMSKTTRSEKIYGGFLLRLLTNNRLGKWVTAFIARRPLFSHLVGRWQRQRFTRHKISAFVKRFGIDSSEFAQPISNFSSFNDFFMRHLSAESRPIDHLNDSAIIPADGRYKFFERIEESFPLFIKGNEILFSSLLPNSELLYPFLGGTLILGRLSPVDCHRFYSPDRAVAASPMPIEGALYPVNPLATGQDGSILARNRKTLIELQTENFGKVLIIAIGATCVGSIHMTYEPGRSLKKGAELGCYSFGGSAIIMLFAPRALKLALDLRQLAEQPLEIYCKKGQFLGARSKKELDAN